MAKEIIYNVATGETIEIDHPDEEIEPEETEPAPPTLEERLAEAEAFIAVLMGDEPDA